MPRSSRISATCFVIFLVPSVSVIGEGVLQGLSSIRADGRDLEAVVARVNILEAQMKATAHKHQAELSAMSTKHDEELAAMKAKEQKHFEKISATEKELEGCLSLKGNSAVKQLQEREAMEAQQVQKLSTEMAATQQEDEAAGMSTIGEAGSALRGVPRRVLREGHSAVLHTSLKEESDTEPSAVQGCPYDLNGKDIDERCGSKFPPEACLDAGHQGYVKSMQKCRRMCTIARHPEWNGTLWCDPAVHAIHMKGPVYMPSGMLPIGHQNCKSKYRAQMYDYDETPLSKNGDKEPHGFEAVDAGVLHNRRKATSSPVAVCGECKDQSFLLEPAVVVGYRKVLGVCTPLLAHPLAVQMRKTCMNMANCTSSSMQMRCEEFISGFGAVERVIPSHKKGSMFAYHTHGKDEWNGGTKATDGTRPPSGLGVAFTCAGITIRDANDAAFWDASDGSRGKVRVYRAAVGYIVECHSSKEVAHNAVDSQPKLHCSRHEETKGCKTKLVELTDAGQGQDGVTTKNYKSVFRVIKARENVHDALGWLAQKWAKATFTALDSGNETTADSEWEDCDFVAKSRMVSKS